MMSSMGICEARNKRQNCKRGVQEYKARHGSNNASAIRPVQHRARLLQGQSRIFPHMCLCDQGTKYHLHVVKHTTDVFTTNGVATVTVVVMHLRTIHTKGHSWRHTLWW